MDTRAHASTSSSSSMPSSSRHASPTILAGMSTPKTARPRIPLGELPISSFLSAANASASSPSSTTGVSPILKPVATRHFASSPTRAKKRTAPTSTSTPHTPPHHETHPINVRPHHPHVATGLASPSDRAAPALPASPTTCVAPATPPPSLLKRHHHHQAAAATSPAPQHTSSSSSSPHEQAGTNSTAAIPRRKRDRIDDATEHYLARERGQDPVWTSPSPHKNAAIAAAAAAPSSSSSSSKRYTSQHHRRMSSTGSAAAFALSPRFASRSIAATGSAIVDDGEEDDNELLGKEEEEEFVAVKPLRIQSPSTKASDTASATPSLAPAPALAQDVFGVTTSSPSGGLVVFCDDNDAFAPPAAARTAAPVDAYADEDGAERENDVDALGVYLHDKENGAAGKGSSKKGKSKSKSKSPTLTAGSSSPASTGLPLKRKKGTGGRLSLVATGEAGQAAGEDQRDDDGDDEASS